MAVFVAIPRWIAVPTAWANSGLASSVCASPEKRFELGMVVDLRADDTARASQGQAG